MEKLRDFNSLDYTITTFQLPCINGELRRAIHRKHMLYTNFTKNRNNLTWDKFRQQRNLVNKLKRKSMKVYFLERCSGGSKSADFWNTVKPFFFLKKV